ncbi:zinc finger A20 and AN1 domain-containing stress-associated protein 9-like [Argentina anserina]|uniref:zinc finger A20 and AN1 domain-containing stress-associated protein 9-like n=1 Tax=Argentina anserina TaxID=57926 RepID=UPI00217635FC|nr:zinc finger A20 and AN1 domain-containing stress-associated protein 9-like [Potentilla anserina]
MESASNNYAPPLCVKGCGFFGHWETRNMCSTCHKGCVKEEELLAKLTAPPAAVVSVEKTPDVAVSVSDSSSTTLTSDQPSGVTKKMNCCQRENCKKRISPAESISLKCRCGGVFCVKHRYPEDHSCSFNYKEMGKDDLAKKNQVCIADKLGHRL